MFSFQTIASARLSARMGLTRSGRNEPLESERGAIRVGRVVVVDIAVVVDIHKVAGVARIRGKRPPVVAPVITCFQNITGERIISRSYCSRALCFSAML